MSGRSYSVGFVCWDFLVGDVEVGVMDVVIIVMIGFKWVEKRVDVDEVSFVCIGLGGCYFRC